MKDDLWVWHYALESGVRLNSRPGRVVYRGALVRQGNGYGCVHPWPELGDPGLEECLSDLVGEQKGRLVRRTMACVAADAAAREEGRSLFEGLEVPDSHATLPVLTEEAVHEASEKGYYCIKVKAQEDGIDTLREIRRLMQQGFWNWRVDFNEGGEVFSLLDEFLSWTDQEKMGIDFLEDPVPYDGGLWEYFAKECGIALANDRNMHRDRRDSLVLVTKPAVNEVVDFVTLHGGKEVILAPGQERPRGQVVTSYMDHPLGQTFAAWEAARSDVVDLCGLQTHGLFKPDEFTERLGEVGPRFCVPEGTGLGFDDLLERLPWTKLQP